jgi:aryl-alcohol dehydrogenase-like predicted oxidoreductase
LAIDFGITHLDLARSYGYGQAEQFVGKAIKGKREGLILASKFGIVANWKADLLRPLKPLVRMLRSHSHKTHSVPPSIQNTTAALPDRFHDRIPLRSANMQKSLEASLRALSTDYVDFFFIHEPTGRVEHIDELSDSAERLKKQGKIKAWGLAYMRSKEQVHSPYFSMFDILQFDNSPGALGYTDVVARRGLTPNIIFSPLKGGSPEMQPSDKLQTLFSDFPNSVVLCSMYSEKHIRANVDIAESSMRQT